MELLYTEKTDKILKAFYTVYNELGFGYLEKVYERAMIVELNLLGLSTRTQHPFHIYYKEQNVGTYFADLIVDDMIILELKTCETIIQIHENQLLNYLHGSKIELGLILNFGKKPSFKRRILSLK